MGGYLGKDHVYAASFKTKLEGALSNVVPGIVKGAMHEKMAKTDLGEISGGTELTEARPHEPPCTFNPQTTRVKFFASMSLRPRVSPRMNPKSCVVRLRKGDHDALCAR